MKALSCGYAAKGFLPLLEYHKLEFLIPNCFRCATARQSHWPRGEGVFEAGQNEQAAVVLDGGAGHARGVRRREAQCRAHALARDVERDGRRGDVCHDLAVGHEGMRRVAGALACPPAARVPVGEVEAERAPRERVERRAQGGAAADVGTVFQIYRNNLLSKN